MVSGLDVRDRQEAIRLGLVDPRKRSIRIHAISRRTPERDCGEMVRVMSARVRKTDNPIARVLQAAKEGVVFFERAHTAANDPRVREVFGKLLNIKKESLRSLEENLREARLLLPEMEGQPPRIYPLEELQKKECYVCGYSTDLEMIPESCPRCGALRYAFEKEITVRKAWELAESGARITLEILSEAEREVEAKAKPVLAKQIQLEQRVLNETRKELESHRES